MTRLNAALVILLFASVARAAEPTPLEVEKLLVERLSSWEVPGVAIAVVRGDETVLLKGFGKRSATGSEPVTADTLFPLASCSKAFTTTLLAMLVDDGVIDWDDPVRKHLPSFTLSDPRANALLTIRDLLCHRCGLGGHDLLWYRAPWSIDEVLKRSAQLPLDYQFRSGYRYSTIPFLAAGRALEERSGEKWEKLLKNRVCEPLGMSGVRLTSREIPANADRAEGHRVGKSGKVEAMPAYLMREPNPAGSVHATARDLAAWLKFHLSEGLAPDGAQLVSAKNLRETHTPQNIIRLEGMAKILNPDTVQLSYGMGWLVYDHRGKKVLSHGGLVDGFRSQITFLPQEKLGIVVLANLHDTRVNAALTNTLIDLYCGLPAKDWNSFFKKATADEARKQKAARDYQNSFRNPAEKSSLPLADYVGEYNHPAYGVATTSLVGDRLVVSWSSFKCPLGPFAGDTFQVKEGYFEDQLLPFTVKEGKVQSLHLAGQDFNKK